MRTLAAPRVNKRERGRRTQVARFGKRHPVLHESNGVFEGEGRDRFRCLGRDREEPFGRVQHAVYARCIRFSMCGHGRSEKRDAQTPIVPALNLNGSFVPSLKFASGASSTATFSTAGLPSTASDKIASGTVQSFVLSSSFPGLSSRKQSSRTVIPLGVLVTVSTGKPICACVN
jgi:hypothetical protein